MLVNCSKVPQSAVFNDGWVDSTVPESESLGALLIRRLPSEVPPTWHCSSLVCMLSFSLQKYIKLLRIGINGAIMTVALLENIKVLKIPRLNETEATGSGESWP